MLFLFLLLLLFLSSGDFQGSSRRSSRGQTSRLILFLLYRDLLNGWDLQIRRWVLLLELLLLLGDCGTLKALDVGGFEGGDEAHRALVHHADRGVVVGRRLLEIHHFVGSHVEFIARPDISCIVYL